MGCQYTNTQALKQFKHHLDPAREAFLMVIRARMEEINNLLNFLKDGYFPDNHNAA